MATDCNTVAAGYRHPHSLRESTRRRGTVRGGYQQADRTFG